MWFSSWKENGKLGNLYYCTRHFSNERLSACFIEHSLFLFSFLSWPTLLGERCVQLFKTAFLYCKKKKKKDEKFLHLFLLLMIFIQHICVYINPICSVRNAHCLRLHVSIQRVCAQICGSDLLRPFLRGLSSDYFKSPVVYVILAVDECRESCDNNHGPVHRRGVINVRNKRNSAALHQTHQPTATPFIEILTFFK